MQVRNAFLPDYPLILSLLKFKSVRSTLEQKKKKSSPNKGNLLNNSIDIYIYITL